MYRRIHALCYAWRDRIRLKPSYSQWRDDEIVHRFFGARGGIPTRWIYVDVGSNHPTVLSDTYLFYRNGYRGVCVEPNLELAQIFAAFRPRDTVICAAAGRELGLASFYRTDNPVFSSLNRETLEDRVAEVQIVPVITLDSIIGHYDFDGIFLLKTDTEGFESEVLRGAKQLLQRTLLVLAETPSEQHRAEQLGILGPSWTVVSARANTLYANNLLGKTN